MTDSTTAPIEVRDELTAKTREMAAMVREVLGPRDECEEGK